MDMISGLPLSVLTTLLEHIVAADNVGSVVILSLTCRKLRDMTTSAEGFWERRSMLLGWLPPTAAPAPPLEAPRHEERQWAHFFSQRMLSRWRTRRFLRPYLARLPLPARLAVGTSGVKPPTLAAAEQRLSFLLPWELWELYRFRNGQAPAAGVWFVDDVRWLLLDETYTVTRHTRSRRPPLGAAAHAAGGCASIQARAQAEAADLPEAVRVRLDLAATGASAGAGAGGGEGAEGAAAGDDETAPVRMLVFAANATGTRGYAVDAEGCVYIDRGLYTNVLVAASVSSFLQGLLH